MLRFKTYGEENSADEEDEISLAKDAEKRTIRTVSDNMLMAKQLKTDSITPCLSFIEYLF